MWMLLSAELLGGPVNTKTPPAIPRNFVNNGEDKKKTA
jgi:hypothetical protein